MPSVTGAAGPATAGLQAFPVVGIVTDNVDPDGLGRLRVKFPCLHEEPISYWIRQISPDAGLGRGLFALPETGDEVLVLFMQGHVEHGVIVGQFWNGVDKPPSEASNGMPKPSDSHPMSLSTDTFQAGSTSAAHNDRRLWKSRSGHLFAFDDTPGAETVQIWDRSRGLALVFDTANQRILLTNASGDIHIRCQRDLFLEAGRHLKLYAAQNIEGTSGMDTSHTARTSYRVSARQNIEHTATGDFTATAAANVAITGAIGAKVEGSATATLRGGTTCTVQATGMAVLRGAMVMIN